MPLDRALSLLTPYDCPRRGPGRILVIDDDEGVRTVLQRQLSAAGFDAVTASSATEGLEMLGTDGTIRLVLFDLMMPTMDGWSFRRRQLAAPDLADVPAIVLTGAPLGSVSHEQLQASDYLLKPVGREHLISVVSNYCERTRTAA
jgi:CheY-like chemotaxis protein